MADAYSTLLGGRKSARSRSSDSLTRRDFLRRSTAYTTTGAFYLASGAIGTAFSSPAQARTNILWDGGTLVVPAHFDDEALMMLPWLAGARKIVASSLYGLCPPLVNILNRAYGQGLLGDIRYKFVELFPRYASAGGWLWDYANRPRCDADARRAGYDMGRDRKFDYYRTRNALRPHVSDPSITRIVSHSPWGFYGHGAHRMVSAVCRDLAREYGKDMWMLGVARSAYWSPDPSGWTRYRNVTNLGLETLYAEFPHVVFDSVRAAFQNEAYQSGVSTWSWHPFSNRDPYNRDYPHGRRPFLKIVDRGWDLTGTDYWRLQEILRIRNEEVPISGVCGA